ncbi:MAG: site-specific tyrosine recombinase XerD [Oscillospiraceae bacterium]|nr:site-specific tyrosine recombinase XerD [Oscillospiraceae bacterium]
MDIFLERFLEDIKRKKLSYNTFDAYRRDIERFYKYVDKRNLTISSVDDEVIREYFQELSKKNMANSSIVRNIISIRNFYKFLLKNKCILYNPIINFEIPKVTRKLPEILTVEEVNKLLMAPDTRTIKGIRDKAMLELLYASGMRVTELLNIRMNEINLKLNYCIAKGSKNQERIIPIGSYAVKFLLEYLKIRDEINIHKYNFLFLNLKGFPMTRQGFWKLVKEYADNTEVYKKIDPYCLRHSFAVHLIQNGADIKTVQELLGHKDMNTTQIYSVISKKSKIADVYMKTHPRA